MLKLICFAIIYSTLPGLVLYILSDTLSLHNMTTSIILTIYLAAGALCVGRWLKQLEVKDNENRYKNGKNNKNTKENGDAGHEYTGSTV